VVAIAVFASLTVLPAMLSWLGDRVEKGRIPVIGRWRRPAGQSRFWTALTTRVMARPLLAVVLAGGLLVALAIPAFQMKAVTSGVDDLPQAIPAIPTYNKIKAVFPPRAWRRSWWSRPTTCAPAPLPMASAPFATG